MSWQVAIVTLLGLAIGIAGVVKAATPFRFHAYIIRGFMYTFIWGCCARCSLPPDPLHPLGVDILTPGSSGAVGWRHGQQPPRHIPRILL